MPLPSEIQKPVCVHVSFSHCGRTKGNKYLDQADNIQKLGKPASWDRPHSAKKKCFSKVFSQSELKMLSNRLILPYWFLNTLSTCHLYTLIYLRTEGESVVSNTVTLPVLPSNNFSKLLLYKLIHFRIEGEIWLLSNIVILSFQLPLNFPTFFQ